MKLHTDGAVYKNALKIFLFCQLPFSIKHWNIPLLHFILLFSNIYALTEKHTLFDYVFTVKFLPKVFTQIHFRFN